MILQTDMLRIILTVVLLVIAYYGYRAVSWYMRIVAIGRQVDKLSGENKHWLYGTLAEVSVSLFLSTFAYRLSLAGS